jgi:fatty acid desaturase
MNEKSTGGIGFVGWLTLLFIALKLTGFIEWSWFWVLSPLWITFIVLFILIVLVQVLKKDY